MVANSHRTDSAVDDDWIAVGGKAVVASKHSDVLDWASEHVDHGMGPCKLQVEVAVPANRPGH